MKQIGGVMLINNNITIFDWLVVHVAGTNNKILKTCLAIFGDSTIIGLNIQLQSTYTIVICPYLLLKIAFFVY